MKSPLTGQTANYIVPSSGASGAINRSDGSETTFEGIVPIEW